MLDKVQDKFVFDDSDNIDERLRIQYYINSQTINATSGEPITEITWIGAIRCKDKYYEQMDYDSPNYDATITKELSRKEWICPDIDSFLIDNDPWLYKEGPGISLGMVINRCDVANRVT